MKETYPAVFEHLKQFEERLRKRGQCEGTATSPGSNQHHWLELDNNVSREKLDDFLKRKIVFSRISGTEPKFSLDTENHFTNDTGYIISGEHLDYLLDMLVSDIIWFAFKTYYMGGGIDKEFKVNNLLNLPVPLPSTDAIKLTDEEMKFIAENIE